MQRRPAHTYVQTPNSQKSTTPLQVDLLIPRVTIRVTKNAGSIQDQGFKFGSPARLILTAPNPKP